MRVWLRRVAWLVGAVLLLVVLAWALLPPLLKWQAQTRLSEALDRSVTIGAVSFKPWSLELTLDDINVASARAAAAAAIPEPVSAAASKAAPAASAASGIAASAPLLHIARVHADLAISSLWRRAPVIEALEIDAPQLHITRLAPGHYDIDDLLAKFTPRADQPSSAPAHFALYNFQLRDAQLRFDDRPIGQVQRITDLQLALPFLSNLPAEVAIKVEPRLAFKLNGAPFDSGAQATPFAPTNAGTMQLAITDLDVTPYLAYLPASLPVRLTRGKLSADLRLQFALPKNGTGKVALHGTLGARDVALTDAAGAPLLAWQQLELGLRDIEPLARRVALDSLRIDGAQLHLARDAAGRINLQRLAATGAAGTRPAKTAPRDPTSAASAASSASSASSANAASPTSQQPTMPWHISVDSVDLAGARVSWNDAAVKPAAALQLAAVTLSAKQLQWPVAKPMPLTLAATLHAQGQGQAQGPNTPALGSITLSGPVTDHAAKLDVKVSDLSLAALAPYIAQVLAPQLQGRFSTLGQLDWSDAARAPRFTVALKSATVAALRLRETDERTDAASLEQLTLADVQVDVPGRDVTLGKVELMRPSLAVARDSKGALSLQQWLVTPGADTEARTTSDQTAATPWRVHLKSLALDDGQIKFADSSVHRRNKAVVRLDLSKLRVAVQNLEWPARHDSAAAAVQLSAAVSAPRAARTQALTPGLLDWNGEVGLQPLRAHGKLRIERFPLQLFAPYFGDQLPVRLVRAEVGYRGQLALRTLPAGIDMNAAGDVLLTDLRVTTVPDARLGIAGGDELLSWQSLSLKQVKFAMKPAARPRLEIGDAALSDFYSRLVVTEQGHFNLLELTTPPARAVGAVNAASAGVGATTTATVSAPGSAAGSATPQATQLPIDISVGATQLANGKVDFHDHFIRPNYSAALTELNGRIGAFSSDAPQMATLELRGRAEGTALLEIAGQVNPLARPLQLDIHAKATDLELAPLSPYAAKYAGYAIERGKLSMDVAYKIGADGQLTASNKLILNQLTFGEKVASPEATTLPVRLAVALLKDRNGIINLDLPISGSLNDPQFSLGGLIAKVFVNLLAKAITSPFSLLAGVGGGGNDLSQVEFKPGSAVPTASGIAAIDKVAKALIDKPALKMTVTGAADPVTERAAYEQAALDARLLAERRRDALRAGSAPAAAASAPASLSADERARLLRQLYRRSDLPDKPQNVLGFAKDIPGPEMEALLKKHLPVSDDAMRELALQRGVAVRDALIAKGLTSDRLFLAAPKLQSSKPGESWTPQVQLALSVN